MDMNLSKLREIVKDREAWHVAVYGLQRVGHKLATKEQQHYLLQYIYIYTKYLGEKKYKNPKDKEDLNQSSLAVQWLRLGTFAAWAKVRELQIA